jgi:hypothetical protein
MVLSIQNILFQNEIQPHLLGMPVEVLHQILGYLFDEELEDWCPFLRQPTRCPQPCPKCYIPLSYDDSNRDDIWKYILRQEAPRRPGHINRIALVCRGLRYHSRRLLESKYTFLVNIDVREDAPSEVNGFNEIDMLDTVVWNNPKSNLMDNFRKNIKDLAVCITPTFRHFIGAFGAHDRAKRELQAVFLVERIIENLVQLLELLPGLSSMHLVWGFLPGNSGMNDVVDRYSQVIFVRMRAEAEGRRRQVELSAQSAFGMIWELSLERGKPAGAPVRRHKGDRWVMEK